jgi:hypothetical protein
MRARLFVMMSSSAGVVWVVKYGGHDPPCPRRVGALLSWCADSKKAPTKPGLQLPIRRTRPVRTRPGSDNYDARLPRRRQSNIASYPSRCALPPRITRPLSPRKSLAFLVLLLGLNLLASDRLGKATFPADHICR